MARYGRQTGGWRAAWEVAGAPPVRHGVGAASDLALPASPAQSTYQIAAHSDERVRLCCCCGHWGRRPRLLPLSPRPSLRRHGRGRLLRRRHRGLLRRHGGLRRHHHHLRHPPVQLLAGAQVQQHVCKQAGPGRRGSCRMKHSACACAWACARTVPACPLAKQQLLHCKLRDSAAAASVLAAPLSCGSQAPRREAVSVGVVHGCLIAGQGSLSEPSGRAEPGSTEPEGGLRAHFGSRTRPATCPPQSPSPARRRICRAEATVNGPSLKGAGLRGCGGHAGPP